MIDLMSTAMTFAIRNNLVADDGTIVCWWCRRSAALLPSLHCGPCLLEGYERTTRAQCDYARAHHVVLPARPELPQCHQREQTDSDRAAMRSRLDVTRGGVSSRLTPW